MVDRLFVLDPCFHHHIFKEDYQCLKLDYQTISHILQLPNTLNFVSEILFLLKMC